MSPWLFHGFYARIIFCNGTMNHGNLSCLGEAIALLFVHTIFPEYSEYLNILSALPQSYYNILPAEPPLKFLLCQSSFKIPLRVCSICSENSCAVGRKLYLSLIFSPVCIIPPLLSVVCSVTFFTFFTFFKNSCSSFVYKFKILSSCIYLI